MQGLLHMAGCAWRLGASAVCVVIFGCGAMLLSQLWCRLLTLLISRHQLRVAVIRHSISWALRGFLGLCRVLGVMSCRCEGLAQLRDEPGIVLAANHPTLLDYVLIAAQLPAVDCLIKSDLEHNCWLRGLVRSADYLVNNRRDLLLTQARQRLEQGAQLLIFPEGTRSVPGAALSLRRGCANIALRCGRDIRLITISCSETFLTKQHPWYHIPRRKPHFTLCLRERIAVRAFMEQYPGEECPRLARRLTQHLTAALQGEPSRTSQGS